MSNSMPNAFQHFQNVPPATLLNIAVTGATRLAALEQLAQSVIDSDGTAPDTNVAAKHLAEHARLCALSIQPPVQLNEERK